MKTLDELQKMNRDDRVTGIPGKKVIAVGMATCVIAAGARPVMTSFAKEIRTRGVKNVELKMTGCIGMCSLEPIAEVYDEDGTKTIYINLTEAKAAQIVREHIIGGKICREFTADGAE